jgi:cellulose synthase (UDP-forming)
LELYLVGIVVLVVVAMCGAAPLLRLRRAPTRTAEPSAGSALRTLRLASQLSYSELAQRSGLPMRLIAELEHGLRPLGAEHIIALSAALDIAPSYIAPARPSPKGGANLARHRPNWVRTAVMLAVGLAANLGLLWLLTPLHTNETSIWLTALPAACVTGLVLWLQGPHAAAKAPHIRNAGLLLVFASQMYVIVSVYLAWQEPTPITVLHAVAVAWNTLMIALGVFNQLAPRDQRVAPPAPEPLPQVAAVIPTYGEPIEVLEPVLRSLVALDYPREKLHILISDDGRRSEVELLAARYGVAYQHGPQQGDKAGNLNSALETIRAAHPHCDLLITQDADDVLGTGFLRAVVGYFTNERVAFVQTPKDCHVPPGDPFGNRERIFYDTLQTGRNGANASFACGSGVVWRITALERVGGFSTWNLVEDLTTSYKLHSAGFISRYHNEVFSVGLAPEDIPGLLKQRGTWAADTLRLLFYDNPLIKRGALTWRQRLQYLELGVFYLTSAFVYPLLFAVPVASLLLGQFIIGDGALTLLWTLMMLANAYYYLVLANGRSLDIWRTWQYGIGHSPTYFRAFWVALGSRRHKPRYVVTRKTRVSGYYGSLLWPQISAIGLGLVSIAYGAVVHGSELPWHVAVNSAFVLYYLVMLSGICRAALYGLSAEDLPLIGWVVRRWRAGAGQVSLPASE